MKYIKSLLVSLIISIAAWGVFNLITIMGITNTWESLSSPLSKPVKITGILPGLYYTIVVETEDGEIYHNYGDKRWLDESDPDIVITPDDIRNSSMTACDLNQPMFIGLSLKEKKVVECYQSYVQYPETAANLTVLLDQNGEIWQAHQWLGGRNFDVVPSIILILLSTIVLEIIWLMIVGTKNILFRFLKKQ